MLESLLQLDENIFLALNSLRSPFFDRVLFVFSGKYVWAFMYCTMLFALIRGFKDKRVALAWILTTVLAIVLSDQICASVLRPYFERLRPTQPDNPLHVFVNTVNGYTGGRYGFPSCHAANSFALAMVTSLVWRGSRIKWFIFLWAVLNSYSRVYLGVHYPGDLIFGSVLGCAVGCAVFFAGYVSVRRMIGNDLQLRYPLSRSIAVRDRNIAYCDVDLAVIAGMITIMEIVLIAIG